MTDATQSLVRDFRLRYNLPPNSPHVRGHSLDDMLIDQIQWMMERYQEEHPDKAIQDIVFGDLFPSEDPLSFDGILADVQRNNPQLDLHDAVELARNIFKERIGAEGNG